MTEMLNKISIETRKIRLDVITFLKKNTIKRSKLQVAFSNFKVKTDAFIVLVLPAEMNLQKDSLL